MEQSNDDQLCDFGVACTTTSTTSTTSTTTTTVSDLDLKY